jgi:hypothetical protein
MEDDLWKASSISPDGPAVRRRTDHVSRSLLRSWKKADWLAPRGLR